MPNLVISVPPPNLDSFAPKLCFCGKNTNEFHDFLFCSTECARQDSLRSLDAPESHYRDVVRKVQAGIPELYPRRMVSTGHLPPANPPPPFSPPNPPLQRNATLGRRDARDRHMGGFPTLAQVTRKVSTKKAKAGEPLVAARQERQRWEGSPPTRGPQVHTFEQISLNVIPLPESAPPRSLRHVPHPSDGLKGNIQKSVAALLGIGRSRKDKDAETPEKVFGHVMKTVVPPVRKESLPSHHQKSPGPSANPAQKSKDLRRSRSFAGWNAAPRGGLSDEHAILMAQIIKEIREGVPEGFDPRSLFNQEDPY